MAEIMRATLDDVKGIHAITQLAFKMYRDEIESDVPLKALTETEEDIACDILSNHVYVAKVGGKVLGSIRIEKLTDDLAYIYRFSVHPDEQNAGIGTELLSHAISECARMGFAAVALHSNAKYFKLARYYYGKQFYVHSTNAERGYIRALFVKELKDKEVDLSKALEK
jgi:predicted N-acetyltransferase YhbS